MQRLTVRTGPALSIVDPQLLGSAKPYRRLERSDRRFGPTLYPERIVQVPASGPCALGRPWPVPLRNHARQSSLEYAGLRGEGSTPVPLPPPECLRQRVLQRGYAPQLSAISPCPDFVWPLGQLGFCDGSLQNKVRTVDELHI
jgi:hypothetical protein